MYPPIIYIIFSSFISPFFPRPYCASGGATCLCSTGRVSRFNEMTGTPTYADANGNQKCDSKDVFKNADGTYPAPASSFDGAGTTFDGAGTTFDGADAGYYKQDEQCRCGRDITDVEQWSLITENCPYLSSNWRSSSNGHQQCFGPINSYNGNEQPNYRNLYDVWTDDSNRQIYPVSWYSMNSNTPTATPTNAYQTVELNLPQAKDQQMTIKVIDTYGDGWNGPFQQPGTLSLYVKNVES